jgi:cysteine-rich repeat protein
MPHVRSPIGARVAALGALLCALPGAALAHGGRLPLDQWGGYAGDLLRCQRVIAQSASECAAGAWAARRACREQVRGGAACDEIATEFRIAAVRSAALDEIDASCNEQQARDIQYLGTFDLQDDVISFCRAWEDAAESGAFRVDAGACTTAAAEAVTEVMQHALRGRRRAMDRLAASPKASSARPALLDGAERRLALAVERTATRLAARCPQFAARYGRTAQTFVATLATRADCVGGAFYIQDTVLCPPSACGNGVIEPPEACDDGNTAGGDTCPADCGP